MKLHQRIVQLLYPPCQHPHKKEALGGGIFFFYRYLIIFWVGGGSARGVRHRHTMQSNRLSAVATVCYFVYFLGMICLAKAQPAGTVCLKSYQHLSVFTNQSYVSVSLACNRC